MKKHLIRHIYSPPGSTLSTKSASKSQLEGKITKKRPRLRSKWATCPGEIVVIYTWMALCATPGHQNHKKLIPGRHFVRKTCKVHPERTPIACRLAYKEAPQMISTGSRLWTLAALFRCLSTRNMTAEQHTSCSHINSTTNT